jgi:putative ABC transport system substrate-binding protein
VSDRRRFLAGIGALAASTAWSQAKGRVHRVTLFAYFISPESLEQVRARWLARFRELGFSAGEIVLTTVNSGLDAAEAEARARAVVASRPDVICVASTAWTTIFMRLTKEIPIVFYNVADPVRAGLVADFGRPGGNVTGATNRFFELQSKRIELLRELRPGIRRIAIVHPQGPTDEIVRADSEAAGARLGLTVVTLILPWKSDAATLGAAVRQARVEGAVFTFGLESITPELLRSFEQSRLATVFGDNMVVQAGGLVSLGEQRPTHAQRAIDIAARILGGERPANIPVDQLSKFHLALNLKVARHLGIAIPQEVRLRADEVID